MAAMAAHPIGLYLLVERYLEASISTRETITNNAYRNFFIMILVETIDETA
jgi:hypothetical protein